MARADLNREELSEARLVLHWPHSRMFPSQPQPDVLGAFEILERLGAGGVGEAFLARSRGGKLVAIKTIAAAPSDEDERSGDVFVREASVCVRLHHPCIVQVRAFIEEPGFA